MATTLLKVLRNLPRGIAALQTYGHTMVTVGQTFQTVARVLNGENTRRILRDYDPDPVQWQPADTTPPPPPDDRDGVIDADGRLIRPMQRKGR